MRDWSEWRTAKELAEELEVTDSAVYSWWTKGCGPTIERRPYEGPGRGQWQFRVDLDELTPEVEDYLHMTSIEEQRTIKKLVGRVERLEKDLADRDAALETSRQKGAELYADLGEVLQELASARKQITALRKEKTMGSPTEYMEPAKLAEMLGETPQAIGRWGRDGGGPYGVERAKAPSGGYVYRAHGAPNTEPSASAPSPPHSEPEPSAWEIGQAIMTELAESCGAELLDGDPGKLDDWARLLDCVRDLHKAATEESRVHTLQEQELAQKHLSALADLEGAREALDEERQAHLATKAELAEVRASRATSHEEQRLLWKLREALGIRPCTWEEALDAARARTESWTQRGHQIEGMEATISDLRKALEEEREACGELRYLEDQAAGIEPPEAVKLLELLAEHVQMPANLGARVYRYLWERARRAA